MLIRKLESDIVNLALRPHEAGLRRCLKCNQEFHSRGAGNRICNDCRRLNANLGPISEAQMAAQRGVKRMNGIPIEEPNSYQSNFAS